MELGAGHVEGWNNLGNAYLNLKDWKSAEYALLNGIRVHSYSPSASVRFCWNNVGLVYRNMAFKDDPKLDADANALRRITLVKEASRRFTGAIQVATSFNRHYGVAWMNLIDAESALRKLAQTPEARTQHAQAVVKALDDYMRVSVLQKLPPARVSLMHGLEAYLALRQTGKGMQILEQLGFQYYSAGLVDMREAYARAALASAMVGDPGARELLERAHAVLTTEYAKFEEVAASNDKVTPGMGARLLLLRILIAESIGQQEDAQALIQRALQLDPQLGADLDKLRNTFRPK